MIGTTGANIVIIFYLLVACVLGIGAGGLTCFALRRSWNLKQAVVDAALALLVAVVTAYVVAEADIARGVREPSWALIITIAIASIVTRHFIRKQE